MAAGHPPRLPAHCCMASPPHHQILVLDEGTSALDSMTERMIQVRGRRGGRVGARPLRREETPAGCVGQLLWRLVWPPCPLPVTSSCRRLPACLRRSRWRACGSTAPRSSSRTACRPWPMVSAPHVGLESAACPGWLAGTAQRCRTVPALLLCSLCLVVAQPPPITPATARPCSRPDARL